MTFNRREIKEFMDIELHKRMLICICCSLEMKGDLIHEDLVEEVALRFPVGTKEHAILLRYVECENPWQMPHVEEILDNL